MSKLENKNHQNRVPLSPLKSCKSKDLWDFFSMLGTSIV